VIHFDGSFATPRFTLDAAFDGGRGVTALFGPSGAGKSTVIRLIAGLSRLDRGRIVLGSRVLDDPAAGIFVRPHRRHIGLVFQDAALLPHLTVAGNLAYGRRFTPPERRRIAPDAVVDMLGIGHLMDRRPATLSGGERQRVGIGRALIASPDLLLMDEPLASLDTERKLEIMPFIERLVRELDLPVIYVSHAVEEVARLATLVVRIVAGRVTAVGPPAEVLASESLGPATARFSVLSLLTAEVGRRIEPHGVTVLAHPAGEIVVPWLVPPASGRVRLAVRATDVTLSPVAPNGEPPPALSMQGRLAGTITRISDDAGPFALVDIALGGGERLSACVTRLAVANLALAPGKPVQALIKAVALDERAASGA
jgi:molybdate transport system ATP-binding protein